MSAEYTWLADHPREKDNYRRRYIAVVVVDEIVASGTDLAQVLTRARPFQKGSRRILVSGDDPREPGQGCHLSRSRSSGEDAWKAVRSAQRVEFVLGDHPDDMVLAHRHVSRS
jgi:hypothetical protein